jgi:hypothetical protein
MVVLRLLCLLAYRRRQLGPAQVPKVPDHCLDET